MQHKRDWKIEEVKKYLDNSRSRLFLSKQDV